MTKKGLALTLAAAMVWAMAVPAFGQVAFFRDLSRDHWAFVAVQTLAELGLLEGYPDGTFQGERLMTRYEMAMLFARTLARLEDLLEQGIHETVDARLAELWSAIDELRAQTPIQGPPGPPGAPGVTVTQPIVVEQVTHGDGTTETVVRVSPEVEALIRAIVADELRKQLATMEPETIVELFDDATLRRLIEARAEEVSNIVAAMASEFQGELEALGVRVTQLERLFDTMNARLTALEQQVAEVRSAAETAQGVASAAAASAREAEAAALDAQRRADEVQKLVEELLAAGASEADVSEARGLADGARAEADTAAERAYRARLAAQRAEALARQALEAAERAAAIGELAHDEVHEAMALAQEAHDIATRALREASQLSEEARVEASQALERARLADQQAYRARLTADRALSRVEALEGEVDELQGRVAELARRPVLGGDVRAEYENTVTSDGNEKPIDPRDPDGDKISPEQFFRTSVGLRATVKPSEDVTVEGGVRLRAPLFGPSTGNVSLTDLHVKVTTNGLLRMLYFGSVTGAQLAEGFNKYTLDGRTYEAKVGSPNRGGALADLQVGNVSARLIAARFPRAADPSDPSDPGDPNRNLYGITVGTPLSDGLNLRFNYLWWTEADRAASVQAYGETGGITYDAIYALYQEQPAVDAKLSTNFGDLRVGFTYALVDPVFAPTGGSTDNEKRQSLPALNKLLKEDDGDLLPDQRRYVADAELPLSFLTAIAEKGRHDKKLDSSEFTDWMMFGFRELDLLGFDIGARAYSDTRDGDRSTQMLRADVSRTLQLGLPLTFTGSYVTAQLNNWSDPTWTNRAHLALGVAVNDYALSDALTLNASYKTEQNPIKDDKWTEPANWNPTFEDDAGTAYTIHNRDTASVGLKFQATEALSLKGGYTLERRDLDGDGSRDASIGTTSLGADFTLNVAGADVTLGYGYEFRSVVGYVYMPSAKHTYMLGVKREVLGATLDASYKVVVGRGADDRGKLNATDTVAQLNVTYPLAEALDFTLTGKWGQSISNEDPADDYFYTSVQGGITYEF